MPAPCSSPRSSCWRGLVLRRPGRGRRSPCWPAAAARSRTAAPVVARPGLPPGRSAGEPDGAGRVGAGRAAAGRAPPRRLGARGLAARAGERSGRGGSTTAALPGLARLSRPRCTTGEVRDLRDQRRRGARPGRAAGRRLAFAATPTSGAYRVGAVAGVDCAGASRCWRWRVVAAVVDRAGARPRCRWCSRCPWSASRSRPSYALVGAPDVALVAVVVETMLDAGVPRGSCPAAAGRAGRRPRRCRSPVRAGAGTARRGGRRAGRVRHWCGGSCPSRRRPTRVRRTSIRLTAGGPRRRRGDRDRRRLPRPGHAGGDHRAARRGASGWWPCCGGGGCGEPATERATVPGRGRPASSRGCCSARPSWSRPR